MNWPEIYLIQIKPVVSVIFSLEMKFLSALWALFGKVIYVVKHSHSLALLGDKILGAGRAEGIFYLSAYHRHQPITFRTGGVSSFRWHPPGIDLFSSFIDRLEDDFFLSFWHL
jgi:hypothetical protein